MGTHGPLAQTPWLGPGAPGPAPEPLESRAAPSPCPHSCGVLLDAGAPTNPAVSVYSVVNSKPGDSVGGAEMQPMRQDIAQVVSILPAQVRPDICLFSLKSVVDTFK